MQKRLGSHRFPAVMLVALLAAALFSVPLFASGSKEGGQPAELRFVAANHPFTDVIKTIIPEYGKKTGVKINLESYEENQLTQKLTVEFASGTSTIDVFMTRPLQEGKLFAKNKYYEFLDNYIKKADASWNWKDFPASTVNAVTFQKNIYAVPIVTEWQTLFYRKDLFQKAGIPVPKNLDELLAAAKALNDPSKDTYGIVSRGQRGAAVTQFSSYLFNLGGDFIVNGRAAFNSEAALSAFKYYGEMLGSYGPPGVTNMSWPQAQALFASGKVAMWTDASTLIAGLLDPAKSQVADKLGVAPFPTGPAGNHAYMVVPWALAMGSQAANKDAAWSFVKWATGKDVAKTALLKGVTVARQSVWDDPAVVKKLFPGLSESAKAIAQTASSYDRPLMTAVGEARDAIGTVITQAIEGSGQGDLKPAADAAVGKVDELLQKAGELGQ